MCIINIEKKVVSVQQISKVIELEVASLKSN